MTLNIKQKLSTWNKHPFLVIGALISPFVIFVVGYMFVYVPIAGYFEKKEFVTAEKKLDELQVAIISKIGQPAGTEKKSSCGYSSAKFDGGRLGCGTHVVLAYPVEGVLQANGIYSDILVALGSSKDFNIVYKTPGDIEAIKHPYNPMRYGIDFEHTLGGFHCGAQIEYGKSGGGILLSTTSSTETLAVELSCGGEALAEHFPLEK